MSEQRIDHAAESSVSEHADPGEGQGLATEATKPTSTPNDRDETAMDADRDDPYAGSEGDTEGERVINAAEEGDSPS
jgi:hypothetical protein